MRLQDAGRLARRDPPHAVYWPSAEDIGRFEQFDERITQKSTV